MPTLVLVGADDTHFLAAADYMARKISGAARVTIPAAGHAPNLHQPALFKRAVEDFLRHDVIFDNHQLWLFAGAAISAADLQQIR